VPPRTGATLEARRQSADASENTSKPNHRRCERSPSDASAKAKNPSASRMPAKTKANLIVFVCPHAADKVSGGRSPNASAFEPFRLRKSNKEQK
jgi:hypothetical protein